MDRGVRRATGSERSLRKAIRRAARNGKPISDAALTPIDLSAPENLDIAVLRDMVETGADFDIATHVDVTEPVSVTLARLSSQQAEETKAATLAASKSLFGKTARARVRVDPPRVAEPCVDTIVRDVQRVLKLKEETRTSEQQYALSSEFFTDILLRAVTGKTSG